MKHIICFFTGHRYNLLRNIAPQIDEVYCKRCNREWAMVHDMETMVPLDDDLRRAYEEFLQLKLKQ